jgi:hypothetical protein
LPVASFQLSDIRYQTGDRGATSLKTESDNWQLAAENCLYHCAPGPQFTVT